MDIPGTLAVALASFVQIMVLSEAVSFSAETLIVGLIFAIGAAVVYRCSHGSTLLRSLVVTLSIGGLGMVLGIDMDSRCTAHVHLHHDQTIEYLSLVPTYMTGLMVLFCVPGCILFCRFADVSASTSHCFHLFSVVPMVVGMLVGFSVFSEAIAGWFDSRFLGHHLSMLAGMTIGSALGLSAIKLGFSRPAMGHAGFHRERRSK